MEDKNRELNVEELKQGAGGVKVRDTQQFKDAMRTLKKLKDAGKTKEEAIEIAQREHFDNFMAGVAYKCWDEI